MITVDPQNADPSIVERAFLQLRLDIETLVLMPMDSIREVLTIPSRRLTLVPNMPECIMGLLHQRSHLYWAVDLYRLLGGTALNIRSDQYNIALLTPQFSSLSLVISGIEGVLRVPVETIEAPLQSMQTRYAGYLQGTCVTDEWTLPILSPRAIASDSRFRS